LEKLTGKVESLSTHTHNVLCRKFVLSVGSKAATFCYDDDDDDYNDELHRTV